MHNIRRTFHFVLGIALIGGFLLSAAVSALYASIRADIIEISDISAPLFHIEVFQRRAAAHFGTDQDKFDTSIYLLNYGIASPIYSDAGYAMLKTLSEQGYAPAQHIHANILMRFGSPAEFREALILYHLAAAQDYGPSMIELAHTTQDPRYTHLAPR